MVKNVRMRADEDHFAWKKFRSTPEEVRQVEEAKLEQSKRDERVRQEQQRQDRDSSKSC